MRQILEIEEHVAVPPMMYSDPFYRIIYLIKEEIRKYKWFEGEKGRSLSWEEARVEWTKAHRFLALEKKITDPSEIIKQNQGFEISRLLLDQQREQEQHPGLDR